MEENKLSGKRILIIGVKFYHFNDEILKKLKARGANVDFFYERDISYKHAAIDTFFPKYLDRWQDRHYNKILNTISGKTYDYLLVIRGYKMKPWFVEKIKKMNPGIETIMYQWDSLDNWDYTAKIPYFNKTYTFDYLDSEALKIGYIPTFHTDEFGNLPTIESQYQFFLYGNYTFERYQWMIKFIEYANKNGYSLKTYLFMSFKRFLKEKALGVPLKSRYLSFKRMTKEEYLESFNKAQIIVDVTTNKQSGLAMRMIDVLGSGKKAITNNPYIKLEPGFDPEQILIFDPNNIDIPESFLQPRSFKKHPYTIDGWINKIFSLH